MAVGWRAGFGGAAVLAVASTLLMGFVGTVTNCPGFEDTQGRFRVVTNRTDSVTISGWTDAWSGVTICAYQQTKDQAVSAVLGCTSPSSYSDGTDNCNVNWYPFSMTVTLLGNNDSWFGQHNPAEGVTEYTRVSVNKSGTSGGLYTGTGDKDFGPSDGSTCFRSKAMENGAIAPITFHRGGLPPQRECATGINSYDGCPFTCNLPGGCDSLYGVREQEFSQASHRANADGQVTALTRFDHFGANAAAGTPSGDWSYQWENQWYYVVMGRAYYSYDSLNIRRGENRRNTKVEAWIKTAAVNSYNQQLGLIARHYDANNYFTFMLHEYGYDAVRLHAYWGGNWVNLATAYPSLNLLGWTRAGMVVRDRGSYSGNGFNPNGYCYLAGTVSGATVVSLASTYCGFAPYGRYGVFSYLHMSPQFWDLDAFPERPFPL